MKAGASNVWGEWWGCSRLPDTISHPCLEYRMPSTNRHELYSPAPGMALAVLARVGTRLG